MTAPPAPASRATAGPRAERAPRLGFLGVGWIGRHRLDAVAASGVADVVAVADTVTDAAAEAAAATGAACAASLDELLAHELDGVVIATPSALHAEQAVATLERGVAVFCQKPLGRGATETAAVVEAARAADRLLAVDLSYRFADAARRVREVTRSGALGDVFAAELVFHNAYGPDKPWFYDRTLAGGGCLIDLGTHLVDLALWTLGWPELRRANGRFVARAGGDVEDYAVAELDLGGVVARLACSWHLPLGVDCVFEASFFGSEGSAAMTNVDGSFYDFRAERRTRAGIERLAEPPDGWGGRAVVDWARRVAAGQRFDAEAERYVATARVLDRIYGRPE